MKQIIAFFVFLAILPSVGWSNSMTSSVYACSYEVVSFPAHTVRMKQYYDPATNLTLGKIDLLTDGALVASAPTRVYQIPLYDKQMYMQLWLAPSMRVDAPFSLSGSNRLFKATLHKDGVSFPINCQTLAP
ncbi:MAG: cell wall hydrolase [Proteobacteria bacterium]|nr:MAG: cell wall hydrolase [Pseudomonadota bacterium]